MNEEELNIGFIGVGVLGKGLALSLAARNYRVIAAHSRSLSSAQWLADRITGCGAYPTSQELVDICDLVFITTPDSAIGEVVASVNWRAGQGVVHCSGTASTDILKAAADQGALTAAFHPFQTFAGLTDPADAPRRLTNVTFAVAGAGWLLQFLTKLAQELGGIAVSINDCDRPLYHASAILSCGYLLALLNVSVGLWRQMGFTEQESIGAVYPLARATLENVSQLGLAGSVTGPIVRGDVGTVRSHLEALSLRSPDAAPVYAALTEASLPLAGQRGVPRPQIAEIQLLIDDFHRRCPSCAE